MSKANFVAPNNSNDAVVIDGATNIASLLGHYAYNFLDQKAMIGEHMSVLPMHSQL